MSDHETSADTTFTRVLGRWDVLAVAFGAMIGFGWIVLTGGFLQDAGTLGAVLAFAIGGVIMCLVGLTYAELVSAMPSAGGEHNYVLRGLGSRAAFVASWSLILGYVSVVAFEAVAVPQTLLYLAPDMLVGRLWTVADYDVYASWAAVGIAGAVGITLLNYVGVRPAAVFQGLAVLFLLGVGLLLVIGSVIGGSSEHLQPLFAGGAGGIIAVLVAVPFLFVGFDVIPQSAEEINLPFKMIGTSSSFGDLGRGLLPDRDVHGRLRAAQGSACEVGPPRPRMAWRHCGAARRSATSWCSAVSPGF
jgi:amino acid transporter